MRFRRVLRSRISAILRRSRMESDLDDEIEDYLAHQTERFVAQGMTPKEAREAALHACGNLTIAREDTRATWTWSWLETLQRDVRIGLRMLGRNRGFSLIAIGVMALCIGGATSFFTVVRSVLLRSLPFHQPDQLVMVYERYRLSEAPDYNAVSPGDFYDWRAQTNGFQDLAAWQWWGFNLSSNGAELPETVRAAAATWNLFPLLGVQPSVGRAFTELEDRAGSTVAMLTWGLFQRRFGGDPGIVGRVIRLNGTPYTVIGILPESFSYPDDRIQVWVPYQSVTPPEFLHHHAYHQSYVIGRTRPDVSLASAVGQVAAVQYHLHSQFPDQAVCEGVLTRSLVDDLAQPVKRPLMILMGAAMCLLFIGCLNVANLLMARGTARQKEIAVRVALGAQRLALIREQMTECFLICVIGGPAGVLLSLFATSALTRAWQDLPNRESTRLDGMVLAFALVLVLAATLLAGLLPAVSSTAAGLQGALQASSRSVRGSRSHTSVRQTLLVVEIAVTVILLVAGGLLLKSFARLRSADLGCDPGNVLTLAYHLPGAGYDTPEKVLAFHEAVLDRVNAIPGVLSAGMGGTLPGGGDGEDDIFTIPDRPELAVRGQHADARIRRADPAYFSTLRIPLVSGRPFSRHDVLEQAAKVIISRQLAREYFPNEDPLGKHIQIPLWNDTRYEIVGVVGDTLHRVNQPSQATIYFPALSGRLTDAVLVVRTAYSPLSFALPVQKQVAALDPELPVSEVLTLRQVVGRSLGNASFTAAIVVFFAAVSLVLASVGLYGVLSYLMAQRTTELGIRIALGAQRGQVLRVMLLDGLRPALVGLGLGLLASIAATRLVESMLFGTKALDPVVMAATAGVLTVVATMACIVPSWRASRLDPVQALRAE